ncbi:hypothetical protein HU200_000148 [Digitaria exilis]|uniref:Uncharacterized protein n=1 Tax=Digitaria exilis TaxID=1010633 RepID=A0A835G0K7_9POAL|nr:hypothetical protein HU200_000148 [Digitaria exilis]CAB3445688.1 unnamed protein product [Digitaria exilis]
MAAKARFVTEVAPAKVVSSVMRRRRKVGLQLDTIVEDEREHMMAAYGSSDHQAGFGAARSKRAPARERTGGLMRELANGQQADGGYKLGHRRVV